MSRAWGVSGNTYSFRLLVVLTGTKSVAEQHNDHSLEYPFPDLASSGCLMVHTLSNPGVEEIREFLESFQPDLVYFGGEQLPGVEALWGVFGARMPTTVYLEIPCAEGIAEDLHSKGIPNVIYFAKTFTPFVACHFRQALFSVLQSSRCHIRDAFMLAHASLSVYCMKDDDAFGPCFIGNAPKIDVGDVDDESSRIQIHDDDVSLKFLVCGVRCGLDSSFLQSLGNGLSVLLVSEIRGSKLRNRVSELPPPLQAGTLPRGMVTMRCDFTTTSSAYSRLLVSSSAHNCLNEQVLESHLKHELIETRQLVNTDCEENKTCLSEARRSAAVACGAPVFEVCMKVPKWASQVLRQLAKNVTHRSLVALGIAGIQGVAVASFEKDDAQRLLFLCNRQGREPSSMDSEPMMFPTWLRPPPPSRIREGTGSISDRGHTSGSEAADERGVEGGKDVGPMRKKMFSSALRPVPRLRLKKFTDTLISDTGVRDGAEVKQAILGVSSSKHASAVPNDVANQKSIRCSSQVPLHSVKLKKHACGRKPVHVCSEEEFLKDLMDFLILQGHSRLVPKGGVDEFPPTMLNKKRLDLFNMYKEVVSIGGFHVGDGINWKSQVFRNMKNYIFTNTGVRSTLKRHYETYLLEYELAHDDIDGKCCLFCHSGADGNWIKCGTCLEWAHYTCDKRPKPAIHAFEDYAERGREYTCPQCTIANFKKGIKKGKYAF